MFKKLLAVLFLVILIPSSGATQTDPIREIVNWFPISPAYRCTIDDPGIYVRGLNYFYGQTELFLAETVLELFNYDDQQFQTLEGTMIFFANQETGTYTIAVLTDEGLLCEMSHGWSFTPFLR